METPSQPNFSHVLYALTRKRAEIAGKIEHNQLMLRQLITELDHIDAAIRIFDPTIDLENIKPKPVPPRHAAFKGEVTRIVLKMLRQAKAPLTSRDIALELMKQRGLSPDDRALSVVMVKRVCACLRKHRLNGVVAVAPIEGKLQGWVLATDRQSTQS
jgi:hypothetical protein